MIRKQIRNQAASYAVAGIFFSMLVAFVAFDLNAVRREALPQYEDTCSAVAVPACPSHATSTFTVFRNF